MKFCLTIIVFSILSVIAMTTEAQVSSNQDSLKVDEQSFKFEEAVTIDGSFIDRNISRGPGIAKIRVLRLNQRANMHALEFHLITEDASDRERFKKLINKTKGYFRISGSILNARLGGPTRICNFAVKTIAPIKDAPLGPSEFVGRSVTFEGVTQPGEVPTVNFFR